MSSPGIILTSRFVLPGQKSQTKNSTVTFSNYIDYMKREEALTKIPERSESESMELERIQKAMNTLSKKNTEVLSNDIQTEAEKLLEANRDKQFSNEDIYKYARYMFRSAALRDKQETDELSRTELNELNIITAEQDKLLGKDKTIANNERRLGDEVIPGAFSIDSEDVRVKDMMEIKKTVDQAQKKDTVLWQDVISFDNKFLIDNGLLDPKRQTLNEKKLKMAANKMMDKLIKEEGLNQPYWFASIHRNTDNIHIHFSTVEQNPSRKRMEYDGNIERRGKRKQKTIDKMKSTFGNELLDMNELYSKISNLRNDSVAKIRQELALDQKDVELISLMSSISDSLEDKWEYKIKANQVSYIKADKDTQTKIDKAVEIVSSENPDIRKTIEEYFMGTDKQNKIMVDLYGEKYDQNKTMKNKREEEMKERLGNALLRGMAEHKINKKAESTRIESCIKGAGSNNILVIGYVGQSDAKSFKKFDYVDKLFWKMKQKEKRELQQEFENVMNVQKKRALNEYEEMMRSVEQAKANQHEY